MVEANHYPERARHLWQLAAAPTVWALHFLACYISAAVWCAKAGDRLVGVSLLHWLIAVYTLLALGLIVWIGWLGWRRHTHSGTRFVAHDQATAGDRYRFIGFAMLLLAGVSFIATSYVAMVVFFFESCL